MSTKEAKGLGEGSITRTRNGRFWARAPKQPNGKRPSLGTWATWEEANERLENARAMMNKTKADSSALHFSRFAAAVLDERELDGYRSVRQERHRFTFHLSQCSIATISIAGTEIGPQHIADLGRELMKKYAADKRGKRLIGKSTVDRCMSFVSTVMSVAVERGLRPNNPCAGIRVKRRKNEAKNTKKWTALSPDEQRKFSDCSKIPYEDRIIMRACWGSGIREGEFIYNDLSDLHVGDDEPDPHLWVRYGGRKGGVRTPPKSGKERKVRLFGDALFAFREWLRLRKGYIAKGAKDTGLIFIAKKGGARGEGKPLGNGAKNPDTGLWESKVQQYAKLAGVQLRPHLHWHCLRHTCASSLIQGHWGRRWTLDEIREHLGHSSIVVTQMYAHLADDTMKEAAKATPGLGLHVQPGCALATGAVDTTPGVAAIRNDFNAAGAGGLEPTTCGFGTRAIDERNPQLSSLITPEKGPLVATLAETLLDLAKRGQHEAILAVAVSLASAAVAPQSGREVASSECVPEPRSYSS